MEAPTIDVKPDAVPSPVSTVASESATDAMDVSSTSKSEIKTSDKSGQTMDSVIADAYKKSTEGSSQEPVKKEVAKEDGEEKDEAKTQEDKEKEVEKPKDETEDEPKADETKKEDDKGPVPYERFQEVYNKKQEAESKLKEIEPMAVHHQRIVEYCSSNSITPEQFSQGLEIVALLNTDPAKALERLTPIINELQGVTGDKLPTDLQGEVDGGDLSLARAKEIAKLRAQQEYGKKNAEHQQKSAQQQREQAFQRDLTTAAQSWESAKSKIDPDYKPKATSTAPDGKWEIVRDKFLALLHQQDDRGQFTNPIRNPQEMSMLLEKAYLQVNETFGALKPRRPATKSLTRTGSSETLPKSPLQAKTIDEAMRLAAAKHGYS